MDKDKQFYAINFVLNIQKLREHYSHDNPKKAYKDIYQYLSLKNFIHRQYSGYTSSIAFSKFDIVDFAVDIHSHFPWLLECETHFDATIIENPFDLISLVNKSDNLSINNPTSIPNKFSM